MRAVNLLPEEARPGNRWAAIGRGASARRVLGGSGIAAGVLALAFAGLFLHQRGVVDDVEPRCTTSRRGLWPRRLRRPRCRPLRPHARAAGRDAYSRLPANRWEDVLRDLSRVLARERLLQSLNATSPTLTAGTGAPAAPRSRASPPALRSAEPQTRRSGSRRCSIGWPCFRGSRT